MDCHHTIEDTGIVLGQALGNLLQDKTGLARYGSFYLPMDESLALCALDLSGRAYLGFQCPFQYQMMGEMETAMVEEFFRAVACNAGITLHLNLLYGSNDHHTAEALLRAFGPPLCLKPQAG